MACTNALITTVAITTTLLYNAPGTFLYANPPLRIDDKRYSTLD
jgi:hypothetical protein